MNMITGQYYHSRIVRGSRALEAAHDFAQCAGAQVGLTFSVTGNDTDASIALDAWPDSEAFGDWFYAWSKRWAIKVED